MYIILKLFAKIKILVRWREISFFSDYIVIFLIHETLVTLICLRGKALKRQLGKLLRIAALYSVHTVANQRIIKNTQSLQYLIIMY